MKYRNWEITRNPKPVPDFRFDWDVTHEDYDGAEDSGDLRSFYAESVEEAKLGIDDYEAEKED